MIIPGDVYPPRTGSFGGAYAIRPYTGTQTPLTPRKVSKRAAERFRRVGKLQNTPLNVSEASESAKTRR